jgi:CheY-like chemotaxis protein
MHPFGLFSVPAPTARSHPLGRAVGVFPPRLAFPPSTRPAGARELAGEPGHDAMRVLIVEDSSDLRSLFVRVLQRKGFRVYEASNGREALACLTEVKPDVIVTDVMMPEMNGIELIRHLRSRPSTAEIPVVVMTAAESDEVKREARRLGAADVVAKPIDPRTLLDRVNDVRR